MRKSVGLLILVSLLVSCAPTPSSGSAGGTAGSGAAVAQPAPPQRITAVIRGTPASIAQQKTSRTVGSPPGLDAIEELVNVGMTYADDKGNLLPRLAEAVPTIENGLWKVNADGTMETTWKLRPNLRWHDGTALTTPDFAFGATVEQDPDLGIAAHPAYRLIDAIETPDPATILVKWKQPFIQADAMFSYELALPLPRHLLEGPYAADRASFMSIPYWSEQFVGTGAFRVKEWAIDSHVVLQAFDGYVQGRPKIDEIEVKFIVDGNTVGANVLARAIDVTLGRTLMPVDQAQSLLAQRGDLKSEKALRSWYPVHAQFVNTSPPVVTDVRFRRALLHGIDRQQMVESLAGGQSPVAHSFVGPDIAEYKDVEAAIVKYDYDPRRATQIIEALGYAKGPDGVFADPSGQKLAVSIWTTTRSEIQPRIVLAVLDYWKQLGLEAEANMIPPQRIGDREYRAQFPAFEMVSATNGVSTEEVRRMHGSSTPLPENRFSATGNNARFRNPENDALIERYITTIPRTERLRALSDFVRFRTEQLPSMGLFYEVEFTLFDGRLKNVTSRGPRSSQSWNAHLWEIQR